MNYLGVSGIRSFFSSVKGFYSGINSATLTGGIDVIVVEQPDGSFKCSPFHVRFGKLGVLRAREKVVDIEVNGMPVPIRMKLGDSGEAFFVEELSLDDELNDEYLATSPIPMSPRHSDNDDSLRLKDRRDTDDSVNVEILNRDPLMGDEVKMISLEGKFDNLKLEDQKGRKRRKKRKRNQGSRSDIQIQPDPRPVHDDVMFTMDEDLTRVSEALTSLEQLELNNCASGMSHSRSFHRDFYSDTEVDATGTPHNSRPSTPIQSDSEYEITKFIKEADDDQVGKWPWGELPSPGGASFPTTMTTSLTQPHAQPLTLLQQSPQKSSSDENPLSSDDESRQRSGSQSRSMLSGMFSFMKRSSRQTSGGGTTAQPELYLDDINPDNMDPEKFALYFPNVVQDKDYYRPEPEHDEDVESGKGSSLPQSPQPGSSPKGSQLSVFMEDRPRERANSGPVHNVEAISLCGNNLALFEQSQLTYDDLVENPDIIMKALPESIVVKMDGKYVSWAAALPSLLSTTLFKRPLPEQVHQKLVDQYVKKGEVPFEAEGLEGKGTGTKRQGSWFFSWRRTNSKNTSVSPDENRSQSSDLNQGLKETNVIPGRDEIPDSSSDESEGAGGLDDGTKSGRSSRREMHTVINIPPGSIPIPGTEKFKKTLRLNSDQIRLLGLRYGQNEAVFSVTTAYQGTTSARCHIYLWKYLDRIVVSDIDGTITKSDVLGHVLPMIGNDWAQSGVAQLFTQIQGNGYKMLYLSSRSIGQASATRDYLRSIKQDDVTLPDGPLLLNPTSLMSAFHREVIEKRPEEFKIACLRDVQLLFPSNPFYAGYGNRINDVWAYRAVEIPVPRIFTINHRGELRHALTNTFQSSYTSLVELVEHIFPVYKDKITGDSSCNGYNTFEFWRDPIRDIALPTVEIKKPDPSTTFNSSRRSN